jgi:perosamine synthetase
MTNLQAAVGVAQLERIEQIVERKRWMGSEYTRRLAGIRGLQLPHEAEWARHVYWMYGIVLDRESGMDAAEFAAKMGERAIETRPFFLGMHEQPVFQRRNLFRDERYPVAERLARHGLYLPSGLALTPDQLSQVCDAVTEVLS